MEREISIGIDKLNFENEKINKTNYIAIVYHYPCYDGGYSALNAWLFYKFLCEKKYSIHFFPQNSINRLHEVNFQKYEKIYILDKGLNEEDFYYLENNLKKNPNIKVLLLDHHVSSIKLFESMKSNLNFENYKNLKIIFDDKGERSACGLSLEYFEKKALKKFTKTQVEETFTENYKLLNDYIEDSDTGVFKMKFTHEFKSGISSYLAPLKQVSDFYNYPNHIRTFLNADPKICMRVGDKSYREYKRKAKNEIAGPNCYIIELVNEKIPTEKWKFIYCFSSENKYLRNYASPILSEISHSKNMSPIGAFLYHCEKDIFKLSLRTHSNEIDLSYICSVFGGGGHKSAAAFATNKEFFDRCTINKIDLYKDLSKY